MNAVIVVCSLFNLMLAIQVRKTIYKNEKFDIVLCSSQQKIKEIYENGELNSIFNNVYYLEEKHYYRSYGLKEKIIHFCFPEKHLKSMLNTLEIPRWDHIFLWNPVSFIYSYYRYTYLKGNKGVYHMYCDAGGGYSYAKLELNTLTQKGLLGIIDRIIYGFHEDCIVAEDYYMFSPEYYCADTKIELVEIPHFVHNDIEMLNKVFMVSENNNLPDILFLDDPYEEIDDEVNKKELEDTRNIIFSIKKYSGKKTVGIRPHPRSDNSVYDGWDTDIYDCKIPFELLCVNTELENYIFITTGSSSAFMPYILFGIKNTIIWYNGVRQSVKDWGKLVQKIREVQPNFYIVNNESELEALLKKITM